MAFTPRYRHGDEHRMIINNSHKFIYIHVPKTAGTSVRMRLHDYAGPADLYLGDGVGYRSAEMKGFGRIVTEMTPLWKEFWGLDKHSPVRRMRERLSSPIWDEYFKFAFVRNPFARTWSGFRYVQRIKAMNGIFVDMSFSEFLNSDHFLKKPILPISSQVRFLKPVNEVDYIGRTETLADDMVQIASIIERRPVAESTLSRLNASAKPDAWMQMSDDDRAIIREVLAQDFARFGYSPEDGSFTGPVRMPPRGDRGWRRLGGQAKAKADHAPD